MRNEFFLLHIKTGVLIMSYDYSENILVQESAGNLLRDELGGEQKLHIIIIFPVICFLR